jgi:hypothetical protein
MMLMQEGSRTPVVVCPQAFSGVVELVLRRDLRAWFVHHMTLALMLYLSPSVSVISYKSSRKTIVEQAVQFALLGAGLKGEAINRYYMTKVPQQPEAATFLGLQVSE